MSDDASRHDEIRASYERAVARAKDLREISALRTLGESPERAIIEVKLNAVEAGREVHAQPPYQHIDQDGMRQEIVRWATQAYFAQ